VKLLPTSRCLSGVPPVAKRGAWRGVPVRGRGTGIAGGARNFPVWRRQNGRPRGCAASNARLTSEFRGRIVFFRNEMFAKRVIGRWAWKEIVKVRRPVEDSSAGRTGGASRGRPGTRGIKGERDRQHERMANGLLQLLRHREAMSVGRALAVSRFLGGSPSERNLFSGVFRPEEVRPRFPRRGYGPPPSASVRARVRTFRPCVFHWRTRKARGSKRGRPADESAERRGRGSRLEAPPGVILAHEHARPSRARRRSTTGLPPSPPRSADAARVSVHSPGRDPPPRGDCRSSVDSASGVLRGTRSAKGASFGAQRGISTEGRG